MDPFGHSSANAKIFAELGLEAVVFARINEKDKANRKESKDLQFVWSPKFSFDDDNNSETKEIFAQVLYDHYDPPSFIPSYYVKFWSTKNRESMR